MREGNVEWKEGSVHEGGMEEGKKERWWGYTEWDGVWGGGREEKGVGWDVVGKVGGREYV